MNLINKSIKKSEKQGIKRTKGEKVVFAIMLVILIIYAFTFIIAYLFAFMNAFKSPMEYILTSRFSLPEKWEIENFVEVFKVLEVNGNGYFQMVANSVFFMLSGSIPSLLSTAFASYAYSRFKFPGRKIIFVINIMMLTISLPGSQAAFYKLFCDLGMKNSWRFLFGCFDGFGSRFIIFTGFGRVLIGHTQKQDI